MKKNFIIFNILIILVCNVFVNKVFAYDIMAENFLNFKLDRINNEVHYEIIDNNDSTKTYVLYNYDGDLYNYDSLIKEPSNLINLKKATSSIIIENKYLDMKKNIISTKSNIDENINSGVSIPIIEEFDEDDDNEAGYDLNWLLKVPSNKTKSKKDEELIKVLNIFKCESNLYYPVVFRKKIKLKIPREIINNMKLYDSLVLFNVARSDMKCEDAWKFRYIEDIFVNRNNLGLIDTEDKRHTTCLEIKYMGRYQDVNIMKFEYKQANKYSGYAYIDVEHILDADEVEDKSELDYNFMSDEWQVNFDDGDIDFYLRKWVTYKLYIKKDVFERSNIEINDELLGVSFDENGYVDNIELSKRIDLK